MAFTQLIITIGQELAFALAVVRGLRMTAELDEPNNVANVVSGDRRRLPILSMFLHVIQLALIIYLISAITFLVFVVKGLLGR